ncbi:MAG: tRNA (adenosine(37)-N6)-threonylcarbamoyltransferase complex transferase subunit TsaD [Pyrinomonadaceae bacterium]
MIILGIETSCDETAAAVVRDGREILSSVIASQINLHKAFGGVVPELASREHLDKIGPIVDKALTDAGVTLKRIDAVAVTQGPGLVGALLVGVCYAKALAYGLGIPFVGVNHIEGHVYSVVFENPPIKYPVLALIVSGGHTNLFHVPEAGRYEIYSRTRDDAAGEAFDKVAKMLGLGYPGGPIIERLAASGDDNAIKFTKPKISDGRPDFSFSGLKTAVARYIKENNIAKLENGSEPGSEIRDLAASFQRAVVSFLLEKLERAAIELSPQTFIVAGGVACNGALRSAAADLAKSLKIPVYFPSLQLSTDNAAMIAAAGFAALSIGKTSDLSMTADVTLRLQTDAQAEQIQNRGRVRYRL